MALVNFKKGTQSDYDDNLSSYSSYIYAAEDTRNVYVFGVLQQGISDDDFAKLSSFDNSVISVINSQKNINNGIAGLDENGFIPSSILPSYVDDVIESSNYSALPESGEGGKIYVTLDDNKTYRWSGSSYVEISASIALGETTGTAYEGSKGKALADAANTNPNTLVTGFGAVTPNANQISIAFTDADKNTGNNQYSAGDGGNIIIPAASTSVAGLMSAADKAALDALNGDGEGSLTDISQKVTELEGKVGDTADLDTDAKDNLVAAINEVNTNADAAKEAVDTLEAAVVKQIKVGTNEAVSPVEGLVNIANATTSADGAMSKEDKTKLDNIKDNVIVTLPSNIQFTDTMTEVSVTDEFINELQAAYNSGLPVYVKNEDDPYHILLEAFIMSDSDNIYVRLTQMLSSSPTELSVMAMTMVITISAKTAVTFSYSTNLRKGDSGNRFLSDDGTYKEIKLALSDDYSASTEVNQALEPASGDSYETAISKLHKAVLDNEEVTSQTLVNIQNAVGLQNPNQTLPDLSGTNYLKSADTIVACLQALDTALKTVADQATTISSLEDRIEALEEALTLKTVN